MDTSDLLVELECPVCLNYLTIPIKQCATGHSICGKCIQKLDKCPLCQGEMTNSRNITLEALATKVKYPCMNKHEGCKELLAYNEREDHEQNCTKGFKVSCAMEHCPFIGDRSALKNHWFWKKTIFNSIQKDVLHLTNGYYKYDLMEAFGELFWFKKKTLDDKIYFALQYIGEPEKTEKFYFELKICEQESTKRNILLSHTCSSIKLSDDMIFSDSHHSCILGFDTLAPFITIRSGDGDQVNYTLKVLQEKVTESDKKKNFPAKKAYNKKSYNKKEQNKKGNKSDKNQESLIIL